MGPICAPPAPALLAVLVGCPLTSWPQFLSPSCLLPGPIRRTRESSWGWTFRWEVGQTGAQGSECLPEEVTQSDRLTEMSGSTSQAERVDNRGGPRGGREPSCLEPVRGTPGDQSLWAASGDWNRVLPRTDLSPSGSDYSLQLTHRKLRARKATCSRKAGFEPRPGLWGPGSDPHLGLLRHARGWSQPSHPPILMRDRPQAATAAHSAAAQTPSPSSRTTRPVCLAVSTRSAPGDGLIDL